MILMFDSLRDLRSHVDVVIIISMNQVQKIYCCIEKCLNYAALRFNAGWTSDVAIGPIMRGIKSSSSLAVFH